MSWRIAPEQCALLVIDVQERLLPVIANHAAALQRMIAAIKVAQLYEIPVWQTEQAPEKLGRTVAAITDLLGPGAPGPRLNLAFSKAGCFTAGELPPTLLIIGIETHVCIRQTTWDLRERGHTVYVLADAVSARSETDHRLALHELRAHAGARITTVETMAWEIQGRAEGERFKPLLAILK